MTRRLALLLGIGFLLAAGYGYMDYSSLGFPDGHLTAFEQETSGLRFGVPVASGILGLLGCACGLGWIRPGRGSAAALAAAFCLVIIEGAILPRCPELSACVQLYEAVTGHMPDHGVGG